MTDQSRAAWQGKRHKQLHSVSVDAWKFPMAVNAKERKNLVDKCKKLSFCIVRPEMAGSLGEDHGAGWT